MNNKDLEKIVIKPSPILNQKRRISFKETKEKIDDWLYDKAKEYFDLLSIFFENDRNQIFNSFLIFQLSNGPIQKKIVSILSIL